MSTSNVNEWLLPMPSGISLSPHNSFSKDLLQQFDKRRSQLNFDSIPSSIHSQKEEKELSIHNNSQLVASLSLEDDSVSISSSSSIISIQDPKEEEEGQPAVGGEEQIITTRKSKSAGNLLRKSSVYLRNKFNHHNSNTPDNNNNWSLRKKKNFYRRSAQDIFNNSNINDDGNSLPPQQQRKLSKIAINTTINIGNSNNTDNNTTSRNYHLIQPPIITQYPPKPLKYSPVEPLIEDEYHYAGNDNINNNTNINNNSKRRKTLHRLSLPLLKFTAASQQSIEQEIEQQQQPKLHRRRSDSDLLDQSIAANNKPTTLFHTLGKQWNKLLYTCKNKSVKKKKKVTL